MSETITATQAPERYLELFEHFSRGAATQLGWLKSLRQEGFARFSESGFPTTHDEDWRFTNISPISQTPFEMAPRTRIDGSEVESWGFQAFSVCWSSSMAAIRPSYRGSRILARA